MVCMARLMILSQPHKLDSLHFALCSIWGVPLPKPADFTHLQGGDVSNEFKLLPNWISLHSMTPFVE